MNTSSPNLASQWTRAGALFNAQPAHNFPDLERLLLDTARAASGDSRLYIMAASWLTLHSNLISDSRLAQLIREELEPDYLAAMGLLLDTAREFKSANRFDASIAACSPAPTPQPLFEAERMNPTLQRIAEHRASETSRRWNCWASTFQPKLNAIQSTDWILKANPGHLTT
jgi:hypothetical protein